MAQHSYRIGIDIGGTFTDVVVARDDGLIETRKVPSTPDDYSRGIAQALKALVEDYQTTPDRMFTLMEVECLGACDRAPVLMINDDGWHERLAPEQAGQFVDDLRARGYSALTGCHLHVEKK